MTEKKVLIVALLAVTFPLEAGRSVLRDSSDHTSEDMSPKKEHKKKKEQKKHKDDSSDEGVRNAGDHGMSTEDSEQKGMDKKQHEKQKKHEAGQHQKERNALHQRMTREKGEHEKNDKKHAERRQAERDRKHEAYEERHHGPKKPAKKADSSHDKKRHHEKEQPNSNHAKDKKHEEKKHTSAGNLSGAQRREDARIKAEEKRQEVLKKKRKEADKKVSRLEERLRKLEEERLDKMDKRDDDDKKVVPSHLINKTDNVSDIEKDIDNVKDRLKTREEQAHKVSRSHEQDNKNEHRTRTVLAKLYVNQQKDLRRQLADVKDSLARLKVEEKKDLLAFESSRESSDAIYKELRARRSMKDGKGVMAREEKLGIRYSKERKSLERELERIREELKSLRMKMQDNDKAIDAAAHRAGLKPRSEQRREAELDRYIDEDREGDTRLFGEKKRQVQIRKEDREYQASHKMKEEKHTRVRKAQEQQ